MVSYFDESDSKSLDFTFVCGWTAAIPEWQQFEYDWKIFLAKYDVPYFHMREYAHSVGPFKKWKGKEGTRSNFMRTAASIICDTIQHGFVCCVSNEVFDEVDRAWELTSEFRSPYALAGRTCASLANEWQRNNTSDPSEMAYVFEDGGPDEVGLCHAMGQIKPRLPAPIFQPGRHSKPTNKWPNGRQGLVQLQAADYLAYEMSKFATDHRAIKAGLRNFRISLGVLPEKKVKRFFFTTRKLVGLCLMLNINKRAEI
jgi:hypothetical protein